ncbi:MAG: NYN domain-containing protein [Hyphomicrobiaceae bacterium]
MIRREAGRAFLSAVFVDYDNIYMSLKRKNEEAAKRFARDAASWIKAIESGALITSTNGSFTPEPRRIVMNRCYGNPVPRRNPSDNSTDMNSFPFVRHHFLRAGFEIIDCPPLTAQLKNSSDIRMVMDVVDYLAHGTHFDEFVILSGDADFTPVLHRLRAHARRTVIFANDYTAAPYTAISDGEVREADLITLLLEQQGEIGAAPQVPLVASQAKALALPEADREALRHEIIADVVQAVQASPTPVPLEVLADRAVRSIGHDRTVATSWAGAGGFRELLAQTLPDHLRLSDQPPYLVIDTRRHLQAKRSAPLPEISETMPNRAIAPPQPAASLERRGGTPLHGGSQGGLQSGLQPSYDHHEEFRPERTLLSPPAASPDPRTPGGSPRYAQNESPAREPAPRSPTLSQPLIPAPALKPAAPSQAPSPSQGLPAAAASPARPKEATSSIQQSIARIHEACQAPPLAPPEYRTLFEVMALEINENNLLGAQTIQNVLRRAQEHGLELRRDDVRFVMDVVSEADPWFEQGASANLFAGRFRNFVVARCRGQGLKLSADELDLIEAWFVGNGSPAGAATSRAGSQTAAPYTPPQSDLVRGGAPAQPRTADEFTSDEFPRIVRTRLRG